MYSLSIAFKSSTIHYSYGGTGNHLLFCLHGYGESEKSFHFLESFLSTEYTLIAIDMPYHGSTDWKEGLNFQVNELIQLQNLLIAKHGFSNKHISLLGYSMGGRIALTILQQIPNSITRVILLAPDGLKINFWYWLSTQTFFGNQLFAATIHNPRWFLWMIKQFNRVGLLNLSIVKFIEYYLHDKKMRKLLFLRWTCFRKFSPNLNSLKTIVKQKRIPTHLLYGKYDRIIKPASGEKFRKGIESFCSIEIIDTGHHLLKEKNAGVILNYLRA